MSIRTRQAFWGVVAPIFLTVVGAVALIMGRIYFPHRYFGFVISDRWQVLCISVAIFSIAAYLFAEYTLAAVREREAAADRLRLVALVVGVPAGVAFLVLFFAFS